MLTEVSSELLDETLNMFKCSQDSDIENFIKEKAIKYEERGWCSTYLLLNREKFLNNQLFIDAYFTLSHKVICLGPLISKTIKKKIDKGLTLESDDMHRHFVLIGQLGKFKENSNNNKNINSTIILDRAFEIIRNSQDLITFNCVMVECKDDKKIRNIYESYSFKELQESIEIDENNKGHKLIQYFMRI